MEELVAVREPDGTEQYLVQVTVHVTVNNPNNPLDTGKQYRTVIYLHPEAEPALLETLGKRVSQFSWSLGKDALRKL